jgi:hypothetical protein
MDDDEISQSEVARIMQQIALEYQAASRVFTDFNAKGRHAYLTTCQEKVGVYLEELTHYLSPEKALQVFIQVQTEFAQKLSDDQTTEPSSDKPDDDTTNPCDQISRPSPDKPDDDTTNPCDQISRPSSDKLPASKPDVDTINAGDETDRSSPGKPPPDKLHTNITTSYNETDSSSGTTS